MTAGPFRPSRPARTDLGRLVTAPRHPLTDCRWCTCPLIWTTAHKRVGGVTCPRCDTPGGTRP